MKSDVLDMPVHRVRDKVARTHERGADADFRTRVHLFFNLLFALAEQEELETNGSQYMNRKRANRTSKYGESCRLKCLELQPAMMMAMVRWRRRDEGKWWQPRSEEDEPGRRRRAQAFQGARRICALAARSPNAAQCLKGKPAQIGQPRGALLLRAMASTRQGQDGHKRSRRFPQAMPRRASAMRAASGVLERMASSRSIVSRRIQGARSPQMRRPSPLAWQSHHGKTGPGLRQRPQRNEKTRLTDRGRSSWRRVWLGITAVAGFSW